MYFDEAPKTNRSDIYNYVEEFRGLRSSLTERRRMIEIRGRRRSGKTSLLLSCLNEIKHPFIVLDGRAFASSPQVRREEFVKLLEASLNHFLRNQRKLGSKIADTLKSIQGVEANLGANPQLSLRWGPGPENAVNLASVFDALSQEALRQKTIFIVALDEAQEFRKIMRYDITNVLAHAYDYCEGMQFVVTGSEIGMLHRFLRIDDPKAPLYGRARVEISLTSLSEEHSIEYLREGLAQIKLKVPDEILKKIHSRFDGIIGWVTYCGFKAREQKRLDQRIIDATAAYAAKLAASEFKNFLLLHQSKRYSRIMRTLARTRLGWADLKRALEANEGVGVGNAEFSRLLSNLEDANFISKRERDYFIPDPVVGEAAARRLL